MTDRYAPVDVEVARGWLDAVEARLVAEALARRGAAAATAAQGASPVALDPRAEQAGIAAVAAKFLAVGTPRTLGLVGARDLAPAVVAAQRAYAAPRELRVFEADPVGAARVADAIGGRVVSLAEACACDIVVARGPVAIRREWVRGGTLVTALDRAAVIDPALLAAAVVYTAGDVPGVTAHATLAQVAAGLVDGRVLDEITVLLVG